MKQTNLFLLYITVVVLVFSTSYSYAFNYSVSFTGSGLSSTVDSILVTNSNKGTSMMIRSGETLVLSDDLTAVKDVALDSDELYVFTNSANSQSKLSFYAQKSGYTQVSIFSIDGRKATEIGLILQQGRNAFEMSLPKGIFIVQVTGSGYKYTKKIVSQSNKIEKPQIVYAGFSVEGTTGLKKSKSSVIQKMYYSANDNIVFKGMSQHYATITSAKPNSDTMINFNFVECKDASGNNYAVVVIGTQIWMGENLKTTNYANGDPIPLLTINTDWQNTKNGAYSYFDNDIAKINLYGNLYNWHIVNDSRGICPKGWHVPTDREWIVMEKSLGMSTTESERMTAWRGTTEGNKLKVVRFGGNNSSGFTAIATGYRFTNGEYRGSGTDNNYWTATEYNNNGSIEGILHGFTNKNATVVRNFHLPAFGFCIRCVKD